MLVGLDRAKMIGRSLNSAMSRRIVSVNAPGTAAAPGVDSKHANYNCFLSQFISPFCHVVLFCFAEYFTDIVQVQSNHADSDISETKQKKLCD